MAAYARQARSRELEADAIEICLRATRRLDQLRQAQKETIGLSAGTRGSRVKGARVDDKPTLASQGLEMAFSAALSAKPRPCSPSRSPTRPASARPRAGQGLNVRQAKNRHKLIK